MTPTLTTKLIVLTIASERASEREREREVFVLVPRPDLGTIKKCALLIV